MILGIYSVKKNLNDTSRTRGGDPDSFKIVPVSDEYFPHTRGWSHATQEFIEKYLILPAHAGVIPLSVPLRLIIVYTSRTRGGDPKITNAFTQWKAYFPHTRGWSQPWLNRKGDNVTLPAHAGVWFYTWIGFNEVNTYKGKCTQTGVHFFLDDYQFERIWQRPTVYVRKLSKFKVIASPDFSLYIDYSTAMQIL